MPLLLRLNVVDAISTDDEAGDRRLLTKLVEIHDGRSPNSIERIPAGLGSRRFYRIRFSRGLPTSLVARLEQDEASLSGQAGHEEPPPWLPEPSLEPLRQFLEEAGLPVPRSSAHLPDQGIDLLEDVGDRTLLDVRGEQRDRLYEKAVELIPRLQALSADSARIPAFGRIFDRALIDTKAWKWLHWTIPGLLGRPPSKNETDSLHTGFERIATMLDDAPRRLAHRDFKAENLHLISEPRSDRAEISDPGSHQDSPAAADRLVMIDVQGAFMAPPEYDLVCLLYDLQADLDEDFIMNLFADTLSQLPDHSSLSQAALRFDALATLRLCKDISHLVHAARTRQDSRRWHEIPRGLTLLERASGRLTRTFPEFRTLTSVIQTLTLAAGSSDS